MLSQEAAIRSTMAQSLTRHLPFAGECVSAQAMMLLAAALALVAPQPRTAAAVAQATVTIRVIAAVRLKLDGSENAGAPRAHDSVIRTPDGSAQPAKLIEFQ